MKINIVKYLGKWYEIARIPSKFEQNMTNVTAEYSINSDGSINVINSGYINGELKQITGKALTTDSDDLLKVSFYPNIYSDYKILAVDESYKYALVGGQNENLLWILCRFPIMSPNVYKYLISIADKNGYNVKKLVITK